MRYKRMRHRSKAKPILSMSESYLGFANILTSVALSLLYAFDAEAPRFCGSEALSFPVAPRFLGAAKPAEAPWF